MDKSTRYDVYRITNKLPGSKQGKKYYMISNLSSEDKVKSRIRGMVTSKTAVGGIKTMAKDMKAQGDDYKEDFSLRRIAKGLDKTSAMQLRNRMTKHTPKGKLYNKQKMGPS